MARTLFGEARGEAFLGQVAVAWVIANRASHASGRFGSTIKDVCLRPKQFSCWNADDPNYAKIRSVGLDNVAFLRAHAICALVMLKDLRDPTYGADHYCTVESHPYWRAKMKVHAVIGRHVFLKD